MFGDEILVAKKDTILEKAAKTVFGQDIVESAYITVWDYSGLSKKETLIRLRQERFGGGISEIDNGSKNIIITFKNGRSVLFTNSEWGSISRIDMGSPRVRIVSTKTKEE